MNLQEGIMPKPNSSRDDIRFQHHTAILCFNVAPGTSRAALLQGFDDLAQRIAIMKKGVPEADQEPWLIKGDGRFHLTATWGFGASLFEKPELGLAPFKPRGLRSMGPFPLEVHDADFDASKGATDLLVQLSAKHPFPIFRAINSITKPGRLPFVLQSYHAGFKRADERGMLRFHDGTSNLSREEREQVVPVAAAQQNELEWCDGGSFMVFRKLREDVREWESLTQDEQEVRIGRRKVDGCPLGAPAGQHRDDPQSRAPDFRGANAAVAPDSHLRKTNPQMGSRIFRRGWPYFDGFAPDGRMLAGLLFVSYQRDLSHFETIRNSWMPPGFPDGRAQADGILRAGVIQLVTGGYYFVPPKPARGEKFPGDSMLRRALVA